MITTLLTPTLILHTTPELQFWIRNVSGMQKIGIISILGNLSVVINKLNGSSNFLLNCIPNILNFHSMQFIG